MIGIGTSGNAGEAETAETEALLDGGITCEAERAGVATVEGGTIGAVVVVVDETAGIGATLECIRQFDCVNAAYGFGPLIGVLEYPEVLVVDEYGC